MIKSKFGRDTPIYKRTSTYFTVYPEDKVNDNLLFYKSLMTISVLITVKKMYDKYIFPPEFR